MSAIHKLSAALLLSAVLAGCATGPQPPAPDLVQQIAAAKTPADHVALATRFEQEAAAARENATRHELMGNTYKASPYDKGGKDATMRAHCNQLAKSFQSSAAEYDAMAAAHRTFGQSR